MNCDELVNKIRRTLLNRSGADGVRGLMRAFRVLDNNRDTVLDYEEFITGMKDMCGIILTPQEYNTLLKTFSTDGNNTINVNEFAAALRNNMNGPRLNVVLRAFRKFDADESGAIDLQDLRGLYNAKGHPLVKQGVKSEAQVLTEFLNLFDNQSNPNGCVTQEEFIAYYTGLSCMIDNDDYFVQIVTSAWKLEDDPAGNSKKSASLRPSSTTISKATIKATPQSSEYRYCYFDIAISDLAQKTIPFGKSREGTLQVKLRDTSFTPTGDTRRIIIQLDYKTAPHTSENFRALCTGEYGTSPVTGHTLWYKGLTFHRILPGFCVQSGDIVYDNGKGGESIYGPKFDDETFAISHDQPGIVSMSNTGPNSNSSQFVIVLTPAVYLNDRHVAFGKVVRGLEHCLEIGKFGMQNGNPLKKVTIVDCGEVSSP